MKKLLGYLIIVALMGFLFWNIFQNWDAVSKTSWNLKSTDMIFFLLVLLLVYLSNTVCWHMVTKALGINVGFKENLRVWMISNLSRFLPGGIWQYPSRVFLLSGYGVSKTTGTVAVLLESVLNLGVGAVVVFISLLFWKLPASLENYRSLLLIFLFLALLIVILMNKKIATSLFKLIKRVTEKEFVGISLPVQWILPLALSFFLKFVFIGMALFFLIRLFIPLNVYLLPAIIGIFALSWLLGYITVVAPAGLGVQELSIATLLSVYMPFPIASVIAIAFRLLLLISEALTILIILAKEKKILDRREK